MVIGNFNIFEGIFTLIYSSVETYSPAVTLQWLVLCSVKYTDQTSSSRVCWNPGMMWHAQRCLLYQALKMIIIILLVICYLKPGLVTKTDKLFIHLLLIPWCPKVTGPDKIYGTPLKASDRPLKEGRSSSWKLSLTISCLFKLFPMWHLSSSSEPTSE